MAPWPWEVSLPYSLFPHIPSPPPPPFPHQSPNLTPTVVIAVLFTLAVAAHTIWQQHRGSNPFSGRGAVYTIARLVLEILTFLLWVGSAALALQPHGGCDRPEYRSDEGSDVDWCFKHKLADPLDPHWEYTDQPNTTWIVAIACSFVEM